MTPSYKYNIIKYHLNLELEQLRKPDDLSVSDTVKQAIDLMYDQRTTEPKKKLRALLASNFIGCAQGPEDLSINYKTYLAQDLKEKHDTHR